MREKAILMIKLKSRLHFLTFLLELIFLIFHFDIFHIYIFHIYIFNIDILNIYVLYFINVSHIKIYIRLQLSVRYAPVVTLQYGANLDPNEVRFFFLVRIFLISQIWGQLGPKRGEIDFFVGDFL